MEEKSYPQLKLENQLCFPLYACSKEIVRLYKPLLDPLGLTYTQYLVMMALWEHKELTEKALGRLLWLDSGTLSPVLKKLSDKGFLARFRSKDDERSVIITLTDDGAALADRAAEVPAALGGCLPIGEQDAAMLHTLLYRILRTISPEKE